MNNDNYLKEFETHVLNGCNGRNYLAKQMITMKQVDPHHVNEYGQTMLMFVVDRNNEEICEFLLDEIGVDAAYQDNTGYTALMCGCGHDCVDAVSVLVRQENCNINAKNDNGYTALMKSVDYSTKLVKLLLDTGNVDVNIQNNKGCTALMYACWHGNIDVVSLLLQHGGCSLELKCNIGMTALMYADRGKYTSIVQMLLAAGAEEKYMEYK